MNGRGSVKFSLLWYDVLTGRVNVAEPWVPGTGLIHGGFSLAELVSLMKEEWGVRSRRSGTQCDYILEHRTHTGVQTRSECM